jgi:hypothetical protein
METTERDYIAESIKKIAAECGKTPYFWGYMDGLEAKRELRKKREQLQRPIVHPNCRCSSGEFRRSQYIKEEYIFPEASFIERAWDWLVDSMISLGEHGDKILWLILGAFITIIALGILAGVLN